MPNNREFAGSSGSGATTEIAISAVEIAAAAIAGRRRERSARYRGIRAKATKNTIPMTPALTSHHR
ncbi:hypothetical protein AXK58_03730 [Tsukamurella tyrosinosolvens]|nr:hypothetical protein AXK58_03730 [Tsukamurella tyrosinosolvens]